MRRSRTCTRSASATDAGGATEPPSRCLPCVTRMGDANATWRWHNRAIAREQGPRPPEPPERPAPEETTGRGQQVRAPAPRKAGGVRATNPRGDLDPAHRLRACSVPVKTRTSRPTRLPVGTDRTQVATPPSGSNPPDGPIGPMEVGGRRCDRGHGMARRGRGRPSPKGPLTLKSITLNTGRRWRRRGPGPTQRGPRWGVWPRAQHRGT